MHVSISSRVRQFSLLKSHHHYSVNQLPQPSTIAKLSNRVDVLRNVWSPSIVIRKKKMAIPSVSIGTYAHLKIGPAHF